MQRKLPLKGRYVNGGILTKIPVSAIYPTQIGLDRKGLFASLKAGDTHKSSTEHPVAIKVVDKNKVKILLIEGHHRTAMDILKGKRKVNLELKWA